MRTLSMRLMILAAACTCAGLRAQTTVSTAPVGFVSTTLNAGSDNSFGVPLHQPAALQTTITAISGNVLTAAASLTANQFVYSAGVQPNTYYVLINSSATAALNGTWYQVTANDTSSITVAPNGTASLQAAGISIGDSISVIPFWTLNTLFPNGTGLDATMSLSNVQTQILFYPQNMAGVNLPPQAFYFYYGATPGNGWYNMGTLVAANDQIISPDTYIVIRNVGTSKTLTVTGTVPASGGGSVTTPLGTIASGQYQDNFVVNPFPVSLTLSQLNLYQSGAFTATTALSAVQDQLLLYDPTTTGYNRAPSAILFYYFAGAGNAGNGWYNLGTLQGPLDNTQVFAGGQGFVIRKAANATPYSVNWPVTAPY